MLLFLLQVLQLRVRHLLDFQLLTLILLPQLRREPPDPASLASILARAPFKPIPTRAASFRRQVPAPMLNLLRNLGLLHPGPTLLHGS